MDIDEIHKIIKAFESGCIKELEIEKEGTRLRLVKPDLPPSVMNAAYLAGPSVQVSVAARPEQAGEAEKSLDEAALDASLVVQRSPIVGTFYRAPAPGAEPFVEIGDKVKKGQILCIVEAMKLMNEIESEATGEIVQVSVENGQPVEYGEALFTIRTTS